MARYSENDTKDVYEAAQLFRVKCLVSEGSLLFGDAPLWTAANIAELQRRFVDSPEHGNRPFLEKFEKQIGTPPIVQAVTRLAGEVMTVYFLFPNNVSGPKKREVVGKVLGWGGDKLDPEHLVSRAFNVGVGSGGQGYNTRRPNELYFLIALMTAWRKLSQEEQDVALADAWKFAEVVNRVEGADTSQFRHMIMHLLFPDHFERISSGSHKSRVASVFGALVDTAPEDSIDRRLYAVRRRLEQLRPGEPLDFYWPPLSDAWHEEDDEEGAYAPIDLIHHKKQVVLYGPPGTGKTHRAKTLAERVVRSAALRAWGAKYFEREDDLRVALGHGHVPAKNIHRLQLHPAYGYEDFIRGLHLGEKGETEYRPGFLLSLVEDMAKAKAEGNALPHVLILDEMNRADLSRLLGECFSLLEDREATATLPGRVKGAEAMTLRLPKDLYVIGTMNLIDQSLEQVDFALRRRFLWIPCPFSAEELLRICEARWSPPRTAFNWDRVRSDFERLAGAAAALNDAISLSPSLGPQYEIGHTYFLDVVDLLMADLKSQAKRQFLWDGRGSALGPVRAVWRLSLRPLLEVYLSGLESKVAADKIGELEATFLSAREPDSA